MADETALAQQILDCGDKVRKAKGDKVEKSVLEPLLANLLELKAKYKEVTGKDYVSPAQQKSKKKAEPVQPPTDSKKEGPSKNELKKLAKAAKKKNNNSSTSAASSSLSSASENTSSPSQGQSFLCFTGTGDVKIASDVDMVKCIAAATYSKSTLPVIKPSLDSPASPFPSLVTGNARIALVLPSTKDQEGSLLFGANSIVRYYNSMIKQDGASDWDLDQWLEWEETNLAPTVARLISIVPKLPIISNVIEKNEEPTQSAEYLVDFDEYRQIYQYNLMALGERMEEVVEPPTKVAKTIDGTIEGKLSKEAKQCYCALGKCLETLESGIESGKVGTTLGCVEYAICASLRHALDTILPSDSSLIGIKTRQLLTQVCENDIFKKAVESAQGFQAPMSSPCVSKAPTICPKFRGGIISFLQDCFSVAIDIAYPALNLNQISVQRSKHFGHYQCNSSMAIFKMIKGTGTVKRPSEVADNIVAAVKSHVPSLFEVVKELSVAPQGFINITLAEECLAKGVADLLLKGPTALSQSRLRKVAVDFSSPNIAKEMHVGHLRSTIIGDVLCRILTFVGHEVHRLNHVGDWGTQFGMLILHLSETFPDFTNNPPNITDLTAFYRAAKARFDSDEGFKKQAQLTVVKLQSGDATCMTLWKLLCDISRKEFEKVYDRLDVVITERGESFYNDRIAATIDELVETGVVTSDGGKSQCIFLNDVPFGCLGAGCATAGSVKRQAVNYPLFLRKSDGGYGYDSTDMTAIRHRLSEMDVDWVVYVTDKRQAEHFYMCFEAARRAGWLKDESHRFEHVGFGMVCGDDGKPYKTRSGDTVRLVDLLDMSAVRMKASLDERVAEGKCQMNNDELEAAARQIGYGAVKYFDLKQHPETDYSFSYDKMLDTKGNTAVYLLFAYARFASIVRKGKDLGVDAAALASSGRTPLRSKALEKEEVALALELLQLPDVIEMVLGDMFPHRICDYLYELCTVGTTFVTQCFVLNKDDREVMESRVMLCSATCAVMKKCFDLLGIKPLERI